MDIQAALDDFLLACKANQRSPKTIKWYVSLLTDFVEQFQGVELESIKPREIRLYMVSLQERDQRYVEAIQKPTQDGKLSAASISGHVRALHAFWRWCALEYRIQNPMGNIPRPKQVQQHPKAVDKRDFVKLFNATGNDSAGVRDRAMLAFLGDSGCRLGGLIGLAWSDIQFDKRTAIVCEKGNHQRQVFFTHLTALLMNLWRDIQISESGMVFTSVTKQRKALTSEGVHQILRRLKSRAGVSGRVNPHSFRHRFAISYIENGGDVISLSKILGHTSVKTTGDFYALFKPDELALLHEKFTPINRLFGLKRSV